MGMSLFPQNSRLRCRRRFIASSKAEQLAVSAQKLRLRLLNRNMKLFNDLESNLVHRHLTVCTVCIISAVVSVDYTSTCAGGNGYRNRNRFQTGSGMKIKREVNRTGNGREWEY